MKCQREIKYPQSGLMSIYFRRLSDNVCLRENEMSVCPGAGLDSCTTEQRRSHAPQWTTFSSLLLNMIWQSHGHTSVKMEMTPLSLAGRIWGLSSSLTIISGSQRLRKQALSKRKDEADLGDTLQLKHVCMVTLSWDYSTLQLHRTEALIDPSMLILELLCVLSTK